MPLSLVEVDGHEKRAGVTLLSRYQRYCSVARKRTRFEWANEYGFFRVGGLKCLDTLTVEFATPSVHTRLASGLIGGVAEC